MSLIFHYGGDVSSYTMINDDGVIMVGRALLSQAQWQAQKIYIKDFKADGHWHDILMNSELPRKTNRTSNKKIFKFQAFYDACHTLPHELDMPNNNNVKFLL